MATGGEEVVKDISHDYKIIYITTWGNEIEKKDGELTVSRESGLLFKGHIEKQISTKSLRWISRDRYLSFPHKPEDCFVVSYLDSDAVENVFFDVKIFDEEGIGKCLKCMRDLLVVKYQEACPDDEAQINNILPVLFSQPIFMGKIKASVNYAEDGNIEEAVEISTADVVEFLMILDLECVCLYRGMLKSPLHHLMFWEEEGPTSIERVKLTQKPGDTVKTVCFQTKTMSFTYAADPEIVRQIQNLLPKKKHLMTEPSLLLKVLPRLKPPSTVPTPFGNTASASNPRGPDIWGEPSFRNAAGGDDSWSEESLIAQYEGHLIKAENTMSKNEDIQNMWVTIEFDIKEIMDDGMVPSTDYRSGGMDADDEEHLVKALKDVEDQLKDNSFPIAISRMKACRELFGNSRKNLIRNFFNKSDTDLLRALYYKSLCE